MWGDLKKVHAEAGWKSGIYENEKCIETVFEVTDNYSAPFYHMVFQGYFQCRVRIISGFAPDMTSEVFILAAHFNNLLTNGCVVVDPEDQHIEYQLKSDILVPLLYPSVIYDQLCRHMDVSRDVLFAYRRLLDEGEAPAIIIADLLSSKKGDAANDA